MDLQISEKRGLLFNLNKNRLFISKITFIIFIMQNDSLMDKFSRGTKLI